MIVVKLMGGLGNQMFQYAAGRRLAWRHRTQLKLDLSFFAGEHHGNTPRRFALDRLSIDASPATGEELAALIGRDRAPENGWTRLRRRLRLEPPSRMVREGSLRFDASVLDAPDDSYLEGYWQCERYFSEVAPLIREEFAVREPLSGRDLEVADLMRRTQAVCLHVRRGDYVSSPQVNAFHGTCSPRYYAEAAAAVAERVADPHFFLFSDDPGWVEEHLELPYPSTLVAHNGAEEAHRDLRLMASCRHHIIANSSLSWWGAWLAQHPEQLVVAPLKWFADEKIATDIVPPRWKRL